MENSLGNVLKLRSEFAITGDDRASHDGSNLVHLSLVKRLSGIVSDDLFLMGEEEVAKEVCCLPE